jgi:hypothetical protein
MRNWKKSTAYSVIGSFAADWGWPLRLRDYLWNIDTAPFTLSPPQKTASGWHRERWDSWKLPELCRLSLSLVSEQVTKNWVCDIRDVDALSAANDCLEECADLDDFAVRYCSPYCNDTAEEAIEGNMQHYQVRIDRPNSGDHFAIYEWDRRLILCNAGGAHHFATARYIAGKIGTRRRLCGSLNRYGLDAAAVEQLTDKYAIYAITDIVYSGLWQIFQQFESKYYYAALPWPFETANALFLPKSNARSQRVSALLTERRFFDLGEYLKMLCSAAKHR